MNNSVYSALESKNSGLRQTAQQNIDVAKTFNALISNLIVICNRRGRALKDVGFGPLEVQGNVVRARVSYGVSGRRTTEYFEPRSTFYEYARRKALRLARALDENPQLADFLRRMTDTMRQYAAHKGRAFGRIKIERAIIDSNDVLTMTLA